MKVKKQEEIVRELVRNVSSPPQPPHRIPCPVIVPQRRPRNKDRGCDRAYAPVLSDCGISKDVFLQFLEDWDKASKVGSLVPFRSPVRQSAPPANCVCAGFTMDRRRPSGRWHCRLRPRGHGANRGQRGASSG